MVVDVLRAPSRSRSSLNALAGRYDWKARNAAWEYKLSIRTSGARVWVPDNYDTTYATLSYASAWAILERLNPGPSGTIVDLGSGKGRFLCCAARLQVRKVIGIEFNDALVVDGHKNVARMRGRRAPIEILHTDARRAYYAGATMFYLFNPFGADVLRDVLASIRASAGRSQQFAYAYPLHELVMQECGWLERYDAWPPRADLGIAHAVSFWRTRGHPLPAQ